MAWGDLKGTLSVAQNSITNPTSALGSVAVSVNDLVRVICEEQTNNTWGTCSDNLGNTYNAFSAGTDLSAIAVRGYWSLVTSAGTLTSVDVAATASGDNAIVAVDVFEGPFAASPLDKNPANVTDDITDPMTCPATGVLAQADELILSFAATNGNPTVSADSPFSQSIEINSGTTLNVTLGYRVVAATTSVTPTFDLSGSPTTSILGTHSFKKGAAVITSSGGGTMGAFTASGTAERQIDSTGSPTMAPFVGAGIAVRQVDAAGGGVMGAFVGAGTAERTIVAAGAGLIPAFVGAGTAERQIDSAGSPTMAPFVGAGTAERTIVSAGAGVMPAFVGFGVGGEVQVVTSVGAGIMPAFDGSGAAAVTKLVLAIGAGVMPAFVGSARTPVTITAGGGGVMGAFTAEGLAGVLPQLVAPYDMPWAGGALDSSYFGAPPPLHLSLNPVVVEWVDTLIPLPFIVPERTNVGSLQASVSRETAAVTVDRTSAVIRRRA